jgi:hypothetical protein
VTKSSNHTLSLYRLTSNSSSNTKFPRLSPTDNWLLRQTVSLISRGTDHAAQKAQTRYCCTGVLSLSCLANSLGADHIENAFYYCRVFLQPLLYWSDTQQWMSFIVAYCCTHYPATALYQESVSMRTCLSSRCLAAERYVKSYSILVVRPEEKRLVWRPRRKWENNMKIYLREIGWGGMDWILVAHGRK